jgi:ribosomal protein L12E/L44/L45/RPP1/RPP2
MELKPSEPPGHARRKLRGLVSEIARLRAEGYTIRAIRQALSDAGIDVGWSTVQREVARLDQAPAFTSRAARTPATKPAAPAKAAQPAPRAARAAVEVDRYFNQHNTNPLFRKKGKA